MKPYVRTLIQCFLSLSTFIVTQTSAACGGKAEPAASDLNRDTLVIRVDPDRTFQVIDNFGASDAWTCQYVGRWDHKVKSKIADLLFSMGKNAAGDPKGIGLSAWRFNIGAGSGQQGEKSGIKDVWRRAETFLQENGKYDFDRAAGQTWFLRAAKRRGVSEFIGFCNSAPYMMTKNGLTFSTGGQTNLAPGQYGAFSDYLIKVVEGIRKKAGVDLDYISPVNEPQWDWCDGGQEGSPYRNKEIAALAAVLDARLTKARLKTKVSLAEAGQINYLYEGAGKSQRGTQIQSFFSGDDSTSLLGLAHADHSITAHSYFTTSPFGEAIRQRQKLFDSLKLIQSQSGLKDLRYWMSEYCILGDNSGEISGAHRDLGMAPALYVAKAIHMDLTYAGASAWQWWLAISAYDYKDGLVYVDKTQPTGKFYDSKMLWALGNYSRFVRPGFIRINSEVSGRAVTDSSILVSSFKDRSSAKLALVIVNLGNKPRVISVGNDHHLKIRNKYVTSANYNLKRFKIKRGRTIQLPSKSVITLTGVYR